jgi:hypothetical protein
MRQQRHYKSAIGVAVAGVALLMTTMGDMRLHAATILQREPAIGELRLGQRVLVDDGTCPAGEIKEVVAVSAPNPRMSSLPLQRRCVKRN